MLDSIKNAQELTKNMGRNKRLSPETKVKLVNAHFFLVCPQPTCMQVNGPKATECEDCKTPILAPKQTFQELPQEILRGGAGSREIFGGMKPEEFVDGVKRLVKGEELAGGQKPFEKILLKHLKRI